MNALVYDESGTLVHFVRSLLLGLRHRVSISLEPSDAISKLETSLFDLIVIGPRGAPRGLADRIERETPGVPLILAGTETEIAPAGRIHAAIPRPIRPSRMVSAVERIARLAPPCEEWPAWVAAGGDRVACRATKLAQAAMMLESFAESEQDFARFFSVHDRRPIEASVRRGEIETRFAAAVAFAERGRVAVHISTGGSPC